MIKRKRKTKPKFKVSYEYIPSPDAEEWVKAVNANGNFGTWEFKVLKDPKHLFDVVK